MSHIMERELRDFDPELCAALNQELRRQQDQIELIASENIVSRAVLTALGSVLTNKYAEGYPGKRYYGGCEAVDIAESLALERVKKLFNCTYANVQPHSGAQANQAVLLALLQPGDTLMGLDLAAGGHLTHGSPVSLSGKWFKVVSYGVDPVTHLINYDEVESLARQHKPRLIIAGGSAYPRLIDFERFRKIADAVGAYFMVDMAHFAGLVAGGVFPSPLPHADVVTSTTHKTLRGPRGGIILSNNEELGKKLNSAVFPGLQGGPLMHVIAAKAVAFKEALQPEFKAYAAAVLENARAMADTLLKAGHRLISGGTDSHLLVMDVSPFGLSGKDVSDALESVQITCNKNTIPGETLSPHVTSGIRVGSPAATTRGFGKAEFCKVASLISTCITSLQKGTFDKVQRELQQEVRALCEAYPLYTWLRY